MTNTANHNMDMTHDAILNEMRQQMQTLREELSKERIVNSKMLAEARRKHLRTVSANYARTLRVSLVGLCCFPIFFHTISASWPFVAFTMVFYGIAIAATFWCLRTSRRMNFITNDLVTLRETSLRLKRFNYHWLFFGVPMLFVWVALLFREFAGFMDDSMVTSAIVGTVIGGLAGAVYGIRSYCSSQQALSELAREVEEFKS